MTTPRNAQSATLRGIEFGWQQSLTFLPAPFDGLVEIHQGARIRTGHDEDVGTGGPDLMRGIFPTVVAITEDGAEWLVERFEELAA